MIEREAGRCVVRVPMVMDNAPALLAEGLACLAGGATEFDLSAVAEADSSALAVMLGWLRAGGGSRSTIRFSGIPAGAAALAKLYGVADLLPRG